MANLGILNHAPKNACLWQYSSFISLQKRLLCLLFLVNFFITNDVLLQEGRKLPDPSCTSAHHSLQTLCNLHLFLHLNYTNSWVWGQVALSLCQLGQHISSEPWVAHHAWYLGALAFCCPSPQF